MLGLLIGVVVGAAIGFGVTVYKDYKDDGEVFNGSVSAGEYVGATLLGAALGRFISADDVSYLDPESVAGLNLYAYCNNNPVMNTDPEGTWSWKKFGLIVSIACAACLGVALTVASLGAATPAVAAVTSVLGGAALGYATAATDNLSEQIKNKGWDNVDCDEAFKEGGIGAAVGAISGLFSSTFAEVGGMIGQQVGFSFSQATHIGTGITFGKVFGTSTLTTIGGGVGKTFGTIVGSTFGDYYGSKFFKRDYSLSEKFGEIIKDEIPGLIGDFLKWALT